MCSDRYHGFNTTRCVVLPKHKSLCFCQAHRKRDVISNILSRFSGTAEAKHERGILET